MRLVKQFEVLGHYFQASYRQGDTQIDLYFNNKNNQPFDTINIYNHATGVIDPVYTVGDLEDIVLDWMDSFGSGFELEHFLQTCGSEQQQYG